MNPHEIPMKSLFPQLLSGSVALLAESVGLGADLCRVERLGAWRAISGGLINKKRWFEMLQKKVSEWDRKYEFYGFCEWWVVMGYLLKLMRFSINVIWYDMIWFLLMVSHSIGTNTWVSVWEMKINLPAISRCRCWAMRPCGEDLGRSMQHQYPPVIKHGNGQYTIYRWFSYSNPLV